jgi:hypothetical protein
VTIRFGEPIRPEHYKGREDDSLVLRTITDEVMFEIQQLSGYEYVDTYATRKAEDLPVETAKVTVLEPIDDPSALQAVGAGGS